MARQRTTVGAALNIKIHPHTPERYVALLSDTHRRMVSAKIRGNDWGTIGWIKPLNQRKPLDGLVGEIYKFVNIDPYEPWFNEKSREVIEVDIEEGEAPPVPEHLKPNLRKILFIFYPKQHRLIFDAKRFSPNSARSLLNGIFAHSEILEEYGIVDVHVETSTEAIDKILSIPRKTRLEIYITLPNPDETSDLEQDVINRLNRVRARTLTQVLTPSRGEGLAPDEHIETLMRVAQSNGRVYAEGYDGDRKVEESTDPHPLIMRDQYNPNVTTGVESLSRLSASLMGQIAGLAQK